ELRSEARAGLAPRLPVGARPDARHGRGAARLLPQAIVAVAPEGKGSVPPRELHARRLRRMPLPVPDADGDKEDRGRLLIVGGARELPGPLLLAGRAALRAGAGKVQLAAPAALAVPLGVAFPEARVFPLAETAGGDPAPGGAEVVLECADRAAALLVGPGLGDSPEARALVRAVIGGAGAPVLALDAGALAVIADHPDLLRPHRGRVVVTPHAGEMARLTGVGRERIEADPLGAAR